MIKVMNKRTYRGSGIYIGRPNIFGNPFVEGRDGTREECVAKYKTYFEARYTKDNVFRTAVHDLAEQAITGELVLICWCDPLPCHGHVMRDFIQPICDAMKSKSTLH